MLRWRRAGQLSGSRQSSVADQPRDSEARVAGGAEGEEAGCVMSAVHLGGEGGRNVCSICVRIKKTGLNW